MVGFNESVADEVCALKHGYSWLFLLTFSSVTLVLSNLKQLDLLGDCVRDMPQDEYDGRTLQLLKHVAAAYKYDTTVTDADEIVEYDVLDPECVGLSMEPEQSRAAATGLDVLWECVLDE